MGCCLSEREGQSDEHSAQKMHTQELYSKNQRNSSGDSHPNKTSSIKIVKLEEFYTIFQTIAICSTGTIVRARSLANNQEVAIKSIKKSKDPKAYNKLLSEANILRKLDHPNIIKLYEVLETKTHLHLIQDLCTGGTIIDRIISQTYITEKQAAGYMQQILYGVAHFHQAGILHKDIRPSNLLFENEERDALIKIIDFDMSNLKGKAARKQLKSNCISSRAPEWLQNDEFTDKSDVWSCGIVMHIMLGQYHPFNDETSTQTIKNIIKREINLNGRDWKHVSAEGKDLLSQMLNKSPIRRPTAQAALQHPWFQIINQDMAKAKRISLVRLQEFHMQNRLFHALYNYITNYYLTKEETREMTKVFMAADTNKDGQLSIEELKEMYQDANRTRNMINFEEIMQNLDVDRDGRIDFSEFLGATHQLGAKRAREYMENLFRSIDKNGTGQISKQELLEFFGNNAMLTKKDLEEEIGQFDRNGDGKVDFEEFMDFLDVQLISKTVRF